jgi:hypothetical protein
MANFYNNGDCSINLQNCTGGEKCTTHDGVTTVCDPAGSAQRGQSCNLDSTGADNCTAGTVCTNEGNNLTQCRAFCQTDADCGAGSYCYFQLDSGSYSLCTQPCNAEPPAQQGCEAGLSCFAFYDEYTDCTSPGTGAPGDQCGSAFDCDTAETCIFSQGSGFCAQICQSVGDCPNGFGCYNVNGPDGTWPDYGYCD